MTNTNWPHSVVFIVDFQHIATHHWSIVLIKHAFFYKAELSGSTFIWSFLEKLQWMMEPNIIISFCSLHKKWSFPLRISSLMWPNLQETADLITLMKKSLMENVIFCAALVMKFVWKILKICIYNWIKGSLALL